MRPSRSTRMGTSRAGSPSGMPKFVMTDIVIRFAPPTLMTPGIGARKYKMTTAREHLGAGSTKAGCGTDETTNPMRSLRSAQANHESCRLLCSDCKVSLRAPCIRLTKVQPATFVRSLMIDPHAQATNFLTFLDQTGLVGG
jgi:hypothetical protein